MTDSDRGTGQFLVYRDAAGNVKLDVRLENDTIWLTQAGMAELFQTSTPNVNMHLRNVFEERELSEDATVQEFLIVRSEGVREVRRNIAHYNLDVIISVGYRIRSSVATQFRIWATQRLREYIVKGFVLDDERLKNPDQPFDYFEELLAHIQDIRTSQRRFYQKITDIFTRPASTTTARQPSPTSFSRGYRTSCTGQSWARRRQKSFMSARTRTSPTWG